MGLDHIVAVLLQDALVFLTHGVHVVCGQECIDGGRGDHRYTFSNDFSNTHRNFSNEFLVIRRNFSDEF